MGTTTIRKEPRVSVNALGDYLMASASRRQRIVREQRRPSTFQVSYYAEAEDAITSFVASEFKNSSILNQAVKQLARKFAANDWEANRQKNCIEAIDHFKASVSAFPFSFFSATPGASRPPLMNVSGVRVSVRPEVMLAVQSRGRKHMGLLKLYFGKDKALSDDQGRFIATILHHYLLDVLKPRGSAHFSACLVADVFGERFIQAPRTYKRRRSEVAAACAEIARAWPFA